MSNNELNQVDDASMIRHQNVNISVRDFGPVAAGDVELRPLTVFVGPSNTGKTYLAILIYALHRVFGGFPRLPLSHQFPYGTFISPFSLDRRSALRVEKLVSKKDLQEIVKKLNTEGRPFKLSDLPDGIRESVELNFNDPDAFGAELAAELQRCFDLETVSEVVRQPKRSDASISLAVSDQEQDLWQFEISTSSDGIIAGGRLEEMVLLSGDWNGENVGIRRRLERFGKLAEARRSYPHLWLQELLELVAGQSRHTRTKDTFYLPAVRGGIMQSHRIIASALVARSTRAGYERFPEIPTFSGGVADFMERLILYEDDEEVSKRIAEMAGALEKETLAGRILTIRSKMGGYPEFVYQPHATEQGIRLTRASSMVSELAPVVLFLRGIVGPGDTLIIEEPEAHLHPAAQTQMAMTLARLVRIGVRVVVTTHSDWLLHEIANLMREGEIDSPLHDLSPGGHFRVWLRPEEVGIWLFSHKNDSSGSTIEEIPFDRVEGVEPRDYQEVAEALYNRSAELQNRLAEADKGGRNDGE